jgi:hypothetical protein
MDDSIEALDELANKSVTDSARALRAFALPTATEPVTDYRPWKSAAAAAQESHV